MNVATLKAGVRRRLAEVYFRTGQLERRLRGKVVILTYHRVLPAEERARYYVQPGMYVAPDVFEAQMRFVKAHFEVLSLSGLLDAWAADHLNDATRYCVVTFDDGWRDNYTHAYPILRSLGIPATIFLATRFVGTDDWFWPDRLAYILEQRQRDRRRDDHGREGIETEIETEIDRWKALRAVDIEQRLELMRRDWGGALPRDRVFMSWDEIDEMGRHGVSFGSHSVSHAILTRETPGNIESELRASLAVLRDRGVNYVPVFCYPNGDYSAAIAEQVRSAGYRAAVSSDSGWERRRPENVFALHRVGVHNDVTATVPLFAFRLSGLDETLGRRVRPGSVLGRPGAA
jgi:peptidoglycan/xylan/chitin deacetylase (PgdA/CDA1 family)